ncbi:MAG: hypothetical protein QOJ91_1471 [Sphingomonadales bacterium]|jgi:hypothetical protein|nr:hypothetical protein [Sphingomonadales bacterium]
MNKILLSMAAMGAIAVAAPAAAQSWNNGSNGYNDGYNVNAGGGMGISSRIAQLDARLSAGIQSGDISRSEARSLRMQVRDLQRLEQQYSYNGLTSTERQDLQQRLRTLREDIRMADNGRYDRDTRYGSVNDPYYNNGYDNGGYTGQGGPYEQPYDTYCDSNSRAGLGGLIDGVLGRNNNSCGLRVGARASGNLYSVPSQYRYQFRDGNGVYYRSDGRNIYQIDARTQTVLRIYDIN